jgi:hypothetical protein
MKPLPTLLSLSFLIVIAGCAGPMGPPLGLGPEWDELAGVAIVAWMVALAYRPLHERFSAPDSKANAALLRDILGSATREVKSTTKNFNE